MSLTGKVIFQIPFTNDRSVVTANYFNGDHCRIIDQNLFFKKTVPIFLFLFDEGVREVHDVPVRDNASQPFLIVDDRNGTEPVPGKLLRCFL